MAARLSLYVDREADIIVQQVEGVLDGDDDERLYRLTDALVPQLRDPTRVRILLDGRNVGKPGISARRRAAQILRRSPYARLALWGCPPLVRVTIRFLAAAIGRNDVRAFRTEQEARAWLTAEGGAGKPSGSSA